MTYRNHSIALFDLPVTPLVPFSPSRDLTVPSGTGQRLREHGCACIYICPCARDCVRACVHIFASLFVAARPTSHVVRDVLAEDEADWLTLAVRTKALHFLAFFLLTCRLVPRVTLEMPDLWTWILFTRMGTILKSYPLSPPPPIYVLDLTSQVTFLPDFWILTSDRHGTELSV